MNIAAPGLPRVRFTVRRMMVAVAVLVASFRTTIVAWADEALRADLFVRPMGLGDASTDARFSPHVAERIAALPGVVEQDDGPVEESRANARDHAIGHRRGQPVPRRDAPSDGHEIELARDAHGLHKARGRSGERCSTKCKSCRSFLRVSGRARRHALATARVSPSR